MSGINNYREILRNRDFRTFWLGYTFSSLGDGLTYVALIWFVLNKTNSPEALGVLALAYSGPIVIGGLAAGWLLDRFDRRIVMLADNLIRGAAMAMIPLLNAFGVLEVWHVYVVAAIYGLLTMISVAGNPSIVPSLVEPEQINTANAMEVLSFTIGSVIGPPVAGVLVAVIGAPNVIIIDVVSYFLFAAALFSIRIPKAEVNKDAPAQRVDLRDAFRFVMTQPFIVASSIMYFCVNFGVGMLIVWLPVRVKALPGGGPEMYGALTGLWAAGEVVSGLLAGGLKARLPLGTMIARSLVAGGLILLLMLIGENFWLFAATLALFGFCTAPLTIWAQTIRMQVIPERMRGRTFALLRTFMNSSNSVAGMLAGFLLPVLGMLPLVGLSASFVLLPGVAGYMLKDVREAGPPQPDTVAAT